MKSMWTTVGAVLLAIVMLGLAVYFFTRITVDPGIVYVYEIKVTDQTVTLQNVSFAASAIWYVGYSAQYDNGVLSVKIYGRAPIRFPGDRYNGFTISIPNTYKNLREVRLSGGGDFNDKVIWTSPE